MVLVVEAERARNAPDEQKNYHDNSHLHADPPFDASTSCSGLKLHKNMLWNK
jgi:hypothetical protein